MASWAEDQERSERYDELLREEPGFMPDPKPPARVKAGLDEWQLMRDLLFNNPCQVCGRGYTGGLNALGFSVHHIVPRSQGGDDVPENLAVLCGHGTVGCHGDVEARRNGARERLRDNMTEAQIDYVQRRKSVTWLQRHYPSSAGLELDW